MERYITLANTVAGMLLREMCLSLAMAQGITPASVARGLKERSTPFQYHRLWESAPAVPAGKIRSNYDF